jgi:hypothetical protein
MTMRRHSHSSDQLAAAHGSW